MVSSRLGWTDGTVRVVLDDDMNGLVKIKEVNDFTSAIPEGITLMQWIAYCAYGRSGTKMYWHSCRTDGNSSPRLASSGTYLPLAA